jgi:hypothetical protein
MNGRHADNFVERGADGLPDAGLVKDHQMRSAAHRLTWSSGKRPWPVTTGARMAGVEPVTGCLEDIAKAFGMVADLDRQ